MIQLINIVFYEIVQSFHQFLLFANLFQRSHLGQKVCPLTYEFSLFHIYLLGLTVSYVWQLRVIFLSQKHGLLIINPRASTVNDLILL